MRLQYNNTVISLQLAKELKDLKLRQESTFYWCHEKHLPTGQVPTNEWTIQMRALSQPQKRISAYTAEELLTFLPPEIYFHNKPYNLEISKAGKFFLVFYINDCKYLGAAPKTSDSLCESVGRAILNLLPMHFLIVNEDGYLIGVNR